MLGTLAILAALQAPADAAGCAPVVSPDEFRAWFDAARAGRLVIHAGAARGFRYVFVGGFHNERMPGYFSQNARELRARGVPRRAIHFIYPGSDETVEGNAGEVCDRFLEIAREGPEPLVVIAHSRGACDALFFALRNPEFVRDRVRALFLVQGAFGGTGVADYVAGEGPPMDGRMPWRHRVVGQLLGRLEVYLMGRGRHGGLPALTTQASHDFWARAVAEHAAALPVVGPKTFYVTTATKPSRLRVFQKALGWYLGAYFGPNDGVVALDDQSISGLGTVLAVLDAGHSDLTNRFGRRRLREALTDAILRAVVDPGEGAVARARAGSEPGSGASRPGKSGL
jgi:pimeloyl-ACP methyl ester carboxylesterase